MGTQSHRSNPRPRARRNLRTDLQHARLHRVFRGVDDVRRARHSTQETARPVGNPVRPARGHAGAHRFTGARSARHLDRPLRRAHRSLPADAIHGCADLADVLCHRILALPDAGSFRRPCRWLLLGRHALCRTLVSQSRVRASPWACSAPATRARP